MSDEAEAACASSDEGKPAPAAGGAYNGMIKPLLNMTIYGAVWYQGESNQVRSCSLYLSLQNLPPFRDKILCLPSHAADRYSDMVDCNVFPSIH